MLGINQSEDRFYRRWITFVQEAVSCLDINNFNWVHLPGSGGYYDQDEFFLCVWEEIRKEMIYAKYDESFQKELAERKTKKV